MKLIVGVDGKVGELQLERSGERCKFAYRRDQQGIAGESSLIEVEPGIFSVLIGTRSYEVKVVPGAIGYSVDIAGHRSNVEVHDPRTLIRKGPPGVGEGRHSVNAPMPGKVVRLLVDEGDEVEAGAGLLVVEAMKMQNEMKSPKTGRVIQLLAREGATVAAGQVLAVIE